MNAAVFPVSQNSVSLLAAGNDPMVLTRIVEQDIGAVLWQRPPDDWADGLIAALSLMPLRFSASGSLSDLLRQVSQLVPMETPGRSELLADVEMITDMFGVLMGASSLGIRIATLDGPMCPKWHTDRVTARMMVSLGSAGTEFIDQWSDQPDEQGRCQAAAHDVLMLRGDLWPGGGGRGVWHRSPACGHPRLLLTLDALS